MLRRPPCILSFLLITFLAGCQQRPVMPDEVARDYWSAIKSGNTNQLKALTINNTASPDVQMIRSLHIKDFKIKRTIIEEHKAIVEVNLELADSSSIPVPVDTVLVKKDQKWFVDHRTTVSSLQSNNDIDEAIETLRQFSKMFSRELDQSFDELERQAPVIRKDIKQMVEKMSKRLPSLKKEFEKLLEDIDSAVKPLTELNNKTPLKPAQPPAQTSPSKSRDSQD